MKKNRIGMGFLAAAFMLGLVFTAQTAKAESHFSFGVSVGPSYGYYAPPPAIYRPAYPGPATMIRTASGSTVSGRREVT